MSFDLEEKRLAWIPVKWDGFASNGDETGRIVSYEVEVQVDLVDRDVFQALFVQPDREADPAAAEAFAKLDDLQRFDRIGCNWRGVMAGKIAVPFTPDNVARMMKVANFPLAFFKAYAAAWQAIPETRAGNSEDSPAPGPAASESL